jgi:hypothetical protein
MKLSEMDHQAVIQQIAALLLERQPIDIEELVIVPTAMVSQCLGLSVAMVARRFPITEVGQRTRGVKLKTLKEFISKNTKQP